MSRTICARPPTGGPSLRPASAIAHSWRGIAPWTVICGCIEARPTSSDLFDVHERIEPRADGGDHAGLIAVLGRNAHRSSGPSMVFIAAAAARARPFSPPGVAELFEKGLVLGLRSVLADGFQSRGGLPTPSRCVARRALPVRVHSDPESPHRRPGGLFPMGLGAHLPQQAVAPKRRRACHIAPAPCRARPLSSALRTPSAGPAIASIVSHHIHASAPAYLDRAEPNRTASPMEDPMAHGIERRRRISALLDTATPGNPVEVTGWVKTSRFSKNVSFLHLTDGSDARTVQVVLADDTDAELKKRLGVGAAVRVHGTWVESPGGKQSIEIKATEVEVIGDSDASTFPIQKKKTSMEYLRTIAHMRSRSNTQQSVIRVRNALAWQIHKYFQDRGFLWIHTPILTDVRRRRAPASCSRCSAGDKPEGFFGSPTFLTVSGQLEVECFAQSHTDVYTFGPTFRAENSNTPRHACRVLDDRARDRLRRSGRRHRPGRGLRPHRHGRL